MNQKPRWWGLLRVGLFQTGGDAPGDPRQQLNLPGVLSFPFAAGLARDGNACISNHPLFRWWLSLLLLAVLFSSLPPAAAAQEEVASSIVRYKQHEVSTGYYEEYEVKPRRQLPFVEVPDVRKGIFPYSPASADIRNRSRLSDSHQGIKFYERRRCRECHMEQTRGIHTVRANLTCRQCHGGEPIASIHHYYSPLNPIRRHAYVCSKCHEGSSASYAAYIVHEPVPYKVETQKSFPVLFYAFWIMIAIAVATFALFLPHTILWGVRELFSTKEKKK